MISNLAYNWKHMSITIATQIGVDGARGFWRLAKNILLTVLALGILDFYRCTTSMAIVYIITVIYPNASKCGLIECVINYAMVLANVLLLKNWTRLGKSKTHLNR